MPSLNPERLCKCGHPQKDHSGANHECMAPHRTLRTTMLDRCFCECFVKAKPARQTAKEEE
jgi:hypothetical protein